MNVPRVNDYVMCFDLFAQVVMAPHEQAEEFISSYRKLMQEDIDVNSFQRILEMKVKSQARVCTIH